MDARKHETAGKRVMPLQEGKGPSFLAQREEHLGQRAKPQFHFSFAEAARSMNGSCPFGRKWPFTEPVAMSWKDVPPVCLAWTATRKARGGRGLSFVVAEKVGKKVVCFCAPFRHQTPSSGRAEASSK